MNALIVPALYRGFEHVERSLAALLGYAPGFLQNILHEGELPDMGGWPSFGERGPMSRDRDWGFARVKSTKVKFAFLMLRRFAANREGLHSWMAAGNPVVSQFASGDQVL